MLIATTVLALAALMTIVSVRGLNRHCMREGRPTLFQTLMHDVRKDATPLPRHLDDISKEQAERYALELTTFVVRFVCRDAALTRLTHPTYGVVRRNFSVIIEDAFLTADVDPAAATSAQQVEVANLIMRDPRVSTELLQYCLNHPKIVCGLRASLIDPRAFERSVIRNNMLIVPSVAAMTWLRLTRRVLINAS